MRPTRLWNVILGLAVSAGAAMLVRHSDKALHLRLVNATGEDLTVQLGTDTDPRAIALGDFPPGREAHINLKELPLGHHTAIYIWLEGDGRSFRRTLIYDIDEVRGPLEALVVDYGNGYLDVKMVKQ